jgi:pimeloyl-ACP methyl ester carboxylesterase
MGWLTLLLRGAASQAAPTAAPAPAAPSIADPTASWSSAIDQIRVSARWILSSFAAVGAVLVAGSQLSDLGALEGSRLALSLAGALAALVGIGLAVGGMSAVLTPRATTLSDLCRMERDGSSAFSKQLAESPEWLQEQADSVAQLHERYVAARVKRQQAKQALDEVPDDPARAKDYRLADECVQDLRLVGMQLRPIGGYYRVRAAFLRGRRLAFVGATLVAVGMLAFAYAAHPEQDGADDVALGSAPAAATLSLSGDGATRLADVLGEDCVGPVAVLVLDGAPTSYDVGRAAVAGLHPHPADRHPGARFRDTGRARRAERRVIAARAPRHPRAEPSRSDTTLGPPVAGDVTVSMPVEELWDAFADVAGWPRWNRCFRWAQVKGGQLREGSTLLWVFGPIRPWLPYRMPATARIVELEPQRRVTWEVALPGFHALHTYWFEPAGEGAARFGSWEAAEGPAYQAVRRFWDAHFRYVCAESMTGARRLARRPRGVRLVRYGAASAQPPLVAVPGLDGSVGSLAPVVERLAAHRQVVVVDYTAETHPTLDGLADEIGARVAAEVEGPVDLLGQSIGTVLAARLAVRGGVEVRRVVLVSTFTALRWRALAAGNAVLRWTPGWLYARTAAPLMALVCGPVGDGHDHPFFDAVRVSDPGDARKRTGWEIGRDFAVELSRWPARSGRRWSSWGPTTASCPTPAARCASSGRCSARRTSRCWQRQGTCCCLTTRSSARWPASSGSCRERANDRGRPQRRRLLGGLPGGRAAGAQRPAGCRPLVAGDGHRGHERSARGLRRGGGFGGLLGRRVGAPAAGRRPPWAGGTVHGSSTAALRAPARVRGPAGRPGRRAAGQHAGPADRPAGGAALPRQRRAPGRRADGGGCHSRARRAAAARRATAG